MPVNDRSKTTLRETLEQVEKSTGIKPDQLELPDFPEQIAHVWDWFFDLHRARQGRNTLSYSDMLAWSTLTGNVIRYDEVRLITMIDQIYLEVLNEPVRS